jgi:hypothetical protein
MDSRMRWIGGRRQPVRAAAVAVLACSLGACGSAMNMMPDWASFRLPERSTFVPTRTSVNYSISPTNAVTSADLVDAQGQCAAPATQTETSSHGVSLDMTECQVVSILGQPQATEFPSKGSGDQRRVVMTYKTGERPGIYEFTGGRLTGVQRGDEAPPTAVVKKPPAKKTKPDPPA